jgi:fucose 4-O-acetylase-like acetyltransferase
MSMPSANPNDPAKIELRLRTMRTLWIAMLSSIVVYYVFAVFVRGSRNIQPNSTLFLVMVVVALSITLISFLIKSKLLAQAIEQRRVQQVQQAYIVAWALTEVPALLGMLDYFLTGNPYFYVLFLISVLGQLLHFPRREHVIDASFKSPIATR